MTRHLAPSVVHALLFALAGAAPLAGCDQAEDDLDIAAEQAPLTANAKLRYTGWYGAEDWRNNTHLLGEVAGHTNLAQVAYIPQEPGADYQALANELRARGMQIVLYVDTGAENLMTQPDTRAHFLDQVWQKIAVESDLIERVAFISPREEWYTLSNQNQFNSWYVFQNKGPAERIQLLKGYLEGMIDAMHARFPGIPTLLVENWWGVHPYWGMDFPAPDNLDVLGIDAYFIPTSAACDGNQASIFNREVTDLFNRASAQYGEQSPWHKKVMMVGAAFNDPVYKMASPCQLEWYWNVARSNPDTIGLMWFTYSGGARDGFPAQVAAIHAINDRIMFGQPMMSVDVPAANSVLTSQRFDIGGWAVDQGSIAGTGVDAIHVWAFPTTGAAPFWVGAATYGGGRADIGAWLGARFTPSGFGLRVESLPAGTYDLRVSAHSTVFGDWNLHHMVRVTIQSRPTVVIDVPVNNATVPQAFQLAGWAVDTAAAANTGVDTLHVWAYPVSGGAPVFACVLWGGGNGYGYSRQDVADHLGSAQFIDSGYGKTCTLPPGTYDLVVYSHSNVALDFNATASRRITVQ